MAKYEDYLPGGSEYKGSEVVDPVALEIEQAAVVAEERQTSTPPVDWEKRYEDLEVAYSRQGQQMGDYRKLIDDYVTTTPDEPVGAVETIPITSDDIYENPDEAVRRAVDSHPAIQRARELEATIEKRELDLVVDAFEAQHPAWQDTIATTEFGSWVRENKMRGELATRADKFDMTAADALMTLWEGEQAVNTAQAGASVEALGLETGVGSEAPAPDVYSRSAMLQQKIRAKQGDLEAEAYVKSHAVAYREALIVGNVRD